MATIKSENVCSILCEMLNGLDYWGEEDKEAEKALCYIAGMTDMANAVIKAIKKQEG